MSATLHSTIINDLKLLFHCPAVMDSRNIVRSYSSMGKSHTFKRFLSRSTAPKTSSRGSNTEHHDRVNIIYNACKKMSVSGFSCCVFVNFKAQADSVVSDLIRLNSKETITDGVEVVFMDIRKHYSGLDQQKLEDIERVLTNPTEECGPMTVVITLGLGLGVDFKRLGIVIHYEYPTSISRIVQEWGRAGRSQNIPSACLTFYSVMELKGFRDLADSKSPSTGRLPPLPSLSKLVQDGLYLFADLVRGKKAEEDHVSLSSSISTRLGRWSSLWLKTPSNSSIQSSFLEKWKALGALSEKAMALSLKFPRVSLYHKKMTIRMTTDNRYGKYFRALSPTFVGMFSRQF